MSNTHTKFGRANLNPSEWDVLGIFYQGPSEDEAASYYGEASWLENNLDKLGLTDEDILFHDNTGCASCGTQFFHGAVVHNHVTGDTIAIGGICLGVFELTNRVALAKRNAKKAAERGKARRAGEAFAVDNGIVEALTVEHYITEDIARKLTQYGSLSDAQVALVLKIAREQAEYAAKLEEREAELADAPALTEGRYTIVGTLISIKSVDNPYDFYGGTILKMLVELDDGNRVYGTMPAALYADKGDRVQFDGRVTRSPDDEHFGWYKQPTKSVNLTEQAEKETV